MGQSVVNMLLCRLKGISPSEYDGAFLVYCIIHPLHQNWSPFPFGLGTVSSPGGFPGGGTEAWVRWTTTIRLTGAVDLSGRQTLLSHKQPLRMSQSSSYLSSSSRQATPTLRFIPRRSAIGRALRHPPSSRAGTVAGLGVGTQTSCNDPLD